jgi:hypothetical protein
MRKDDRIISLRLIQRIMNESDARLSLGEELSALMANEPAPLLIARDMGLMPRQLTYHNGAKDVLRGEFFEVVQMSCPEDHSDDEDDDEHDCEICQGEGTYEMKVPIKWDTIKDIYDKAFALLAIRSSPVSEESLKPRFEAWFRRKYKMPESTPFNWDSEDVQKIYEGWEAHASTYV